MIDNTKRAHLAGILVLGFVLGGVTLPGCVNAESVKPAVDSAGPTRVLTKEAQLGLEKEGVDPVLVIVMDRKGQFSAFRAQNTIGTKSVGSVLPAEIDEVIGITIFKTTNPKYCWINTQGQRQCIEW